MALTAAGDRRRIQALGQSAYVPIAAWCALSVALFAALIFWLDPTRLLTSLGDTDDATRLITVRELMAGAPWLDTTLHRFGGPHALVSHWSRLIDLPLVLLLSTFELLLPPAEAELIVRALWPLLVLFAFVYLMARETEARGGRTAALISIPLSATCLIGIVQFLPGRIDHHNVIIVCAVIGILRLARSFDDADAGWSAGVLLGLSTAVGYEALALTAASLGIAMLYGALPRRSLLGPSRAAVTYAATLAIALVLTTAPTALFTSHCDALSFNIVLLSVGSALGVTGVQAFEHRLSPVAKIALLAATGAASLALYVSAEPQCLAGPFGQVDPALFPVWLGGVSETQSMLSLGSKLPLVGGMALVYFLAGGYCGFRLLQSHREDGLRFHMIALLIAIPLSVWQIKLSPYATYLPIPLLAAWLAQPPQKRQEPADKRTLAAVVLGVLVVVAGAGWLLLSLAGPSAQRMKAHLAPTQSCLATAAIEPLAHLPKGLAVADVNLGPYLVAQTNLDVLAAPYHRIDRAILEADHILHAPAQEAEQRLHAIGARYVITCNGLDTTAPPGGAPKDALQSLLFAGKPLTFLSPVALDAPTPLKVWRVEPGP
jgi:hypothetical protein